MGLDVPVASKQSVLLEDIKAAIPLHSSNTDHDTRLRSLEQTATSIFEKECQRSFLTRTCVLTLDRFPNSTCIRIPRPPLQTVTSIQYIDTAGATQTWASSKYIVGTKSSPGKVTPISTESWPSTDDRIEAVTITYVSGWTSEELIPHGIKQALIMAIVAWFKDDIPLKTIPEGALDMIRSYKTGVRGDLFGVAS